MRRHLKGFMSVFAAGSLALATVSCSPVYRTSAFSDYTPHGASGACKSNIGGYALPKGKIDIVIKKTASTPASSFALTPKVATSYVSMVADEEQSYCLDFLSNPLFADIIRVSRENDGLLLKKISSNSEDKSKNILEAAVEGIAVAVADGAGRQFGTNPDAPDILQLQFDPFDAELLTQINEAMRYTGHCIYIDPENDPYVPGWMRNQCSQTKHYQAYSSKDDNEAVFSSAAYTAEGGRIGIFYKPLLSHTLVILKKDDPTSAKPWRVWQRKIIEMPNRAPVFMLEVNRGVFTTRKTNIEFDKGLLRSVTIDKQSELLTISEAFVKIAEVVVQIPAKALIISTRRAESQAAVIRTNQVLLQTYDALKKEQTALSSRQSDQQNSGTSQRDSSGAARAVLDQLEYDSCVQNAALTGKESPEELCSNGAGQ